MHSANAWGKKGGGGVCAPVGVCGVSVCARAWCALKLADDMRQDLLALRADREAYYYGYDQVITDTIMPTITDTISCRAPFPVYIYIYIL